MIITSDLHAFRSLLPW